ETAVRLARDGNVVAMFPEGTRRTKGLVKKFEARPRTGAARIALEAGVPLVAAAIKGTDKLLRLGRLRVAYGPPVEVDDPRVRAVDPRATRPLARGGARRRLRRRQGRWLRGGRLSGSRRTHLAGRGTHRHLGPRRVPARQRPRDDPPADQGRHRPPADRSRR